MEWTTDEPHLNSLNPMAYLNPVDGLFLRLLEVYGGRNFLKLLHMCLSYANLMSKNAVSVKIKLLTDTGAKNLKFHRSHSFQKHAKVIIQ